MPPSKLQFGPYKTERVLGRGGMGVVYAAVDENTGRHAAVKVLTGSLAGDAKLRERFSTEIETLKLLKHPRIVELFGYGEQEGQLFYAMELVAGRSLYDELRDGRGFDWREVTQFGVDVCEALRHAHDHGVIHRDLKPANLLLDASGRVMLSDFGIAKMFGDSQLTAAGGVLGTADFMSPEQAEGRPATPRSDLYSLGSVLYALLTRRAPFESKTLPEVIHRLIHEEPQPVGRLVRDVPEELENLIQQLLEKDPQQRIPSALAVAKRLQAILDERAPPHPKPEESGEYLLDDEPANPRDSTMPNTLRGARPTLPLDADAPARVPTPADDELPLVPEAEVHLKPTVVTPEGAPSRPLRPVRSTRFTSVEKGAGRGGSDDSADRFLWLKLAAIGLVAALFVAGAAYALWPPSADTLYRKIASAAAGQPPRLAEVEVEIDRFLARFASDSRIEQVEAWKEEIERDHLRQRFERQTRRLGETKNNSPVERLYLEALRDAQVAPEQAAVRLQALVDLFGDDPAASDTTKRCVELAREQLKALTAQIESESQEQLAMLTARLDDADELAATDLPAALAIWRGVATLYADKPWAAELVARSRRNLDRHSPSGGGA